jgi:glycosyltransferase 2 family protein
VSALARSGTVWALWPGPLILLAGLLVAAERWHLVLAFFGVSLKRLEALRLYLIGSFYGVVLPGVLGGDAVRVALCRARTGASLSPIIASVAIERGLGLWGVALIGTIGAFSIAPALRSTVGPHVLWIALVLALCAPLALLVSLRCSGLALRLLRARVVRDWAPSLATSLEATVAQLRSLPWGLTLKTLLVSTLFQSSEIFVFSYFGSLLGIEAPFAFYVFVVPLIYLSTVLPISLGGVGVREGVLVWMLAKIGVPASAGVLLAFLAYLNRVAVALIGGGAQFLALSRRTDARPRSP